MVPALFWSQDSSAVPAFARKYQTSCYTCHSGFPNRNAFGEAFKNNGYRWPGGEEEDHAKQEPTKMGAAGWKETFPSSPWPTDIPGFAPFALYVTGPLVNYADQVTNNKGVVTKQQTLYQGGPIDARILFGGTIGDNIGVVGALENFVKGATTTAVRATWSFAPGVNLGFGNNFNAWTGAASPISVYTGVFPTSGTSTELNYVTGKEGGFNLIAGVASVPTSTTTIPTITTSKLDDTRYVRAKYKFFGAGLLSGAGGVYGNEYVGLDNSLAIGVGLVNANKGILTGNYANETLVYGADIAGNYGNLTAGVAYTKDSDLKLNNYAVDAGYYVYPWLLARVRYANLGVAGIDLNNPNVTTSVTGWLRANVSVAASYKLFTKGTLPTSTSGENNQNTFTLTTAFAF